MKNKWLLFGGITITLLILTSFPFFNRLTIVSSLAESKEELIVLSNKVWEVTFSKELDPESVSSASVYVLNDEGEKEKVKILLKNSLKSIEVQPPDEGYNLHSPHYTLVITNHIKTKRGQNLNGSVKTAFKVINTLPAIGSKDELNRFFSKMLKEERTFLLDREVAISEDSSAKSSAESAGTDYSGTNVQVSGIDEADLLKTDGTHIYKISENKVQIIKAVPADKMEMESQLTFSEDFTPFQLFIEDNQLIVMGHSYKDVRKHIRNVPSEKMIAPAYQSTKTIVYNIENKQKPKQIREAEVEGSLLASRLMDGKVYLITSYYPEYWILEKHKNADLRPRYYDTAQSMEEQFVDYNKIKYFPDSHQANYINIAVMNVRANREPLSVSSYLGSGNEFYMSKHNLYLAATHYNEEIADRKMPHPDTSIYKFNLKDGKVEFQTSAEIKGTVLNQFSMDEYKGNFRVVTTKGEAWDVRNPSSNSLYILDKNLKQIGQLEDLAKGERIYSARFMNERIYMVTFKETDPLFVIDGSNPEKPSILGELKIPGFSNYLHPLDENHLIGFGHDTKIAGGKAAGGQPVITTDGIKISLFDVSDTSNPVEKDNEIIGGRGTYSPLNYDHKALLVDKKKNLYGLPISIYQNKKGSQFESTFDFQGALIYKITVENGIELQSKITHQTEETIYEEWENAIERLIYIGDYIYSISPGKINAYHTDAFQKAGELKLN
ncbi:MULTISPECIES: beta-propeller domain-containing protein [unclassified Cytobacillus]|uniref:beta-propeller domain-containing protein n=1 Tax=unclassified Cytobacillus TaxID=2675268 RepID=UPI00203F61E8|nr:beta-propeller domain-containing protein [Cytobacillus sp. AMY 15.2]MCM3090031.1 beta-propeller domain-containing protein [Cytobacillus sp. AMY 15.2]